MARIKEGLDYFSLDVNMNDKMEMVEAEYGLKAFAIMIKLFQKIYSKGYYLKWDEKQKLLFKKCVNEDLEFIESIIKSALKWGVFNEQIFQDYSILTSSRIQKNYIEATKRRSSVQLITQLILVNGINENCHYVDINGENVNIKQKKENILTQRKGKEMKGNKSKGKEGDKKSGKVDYFNSLKDRIDYSVTPLKFSKILYTTGVFLKPETIETLKKNFENIEILQLINKYQDSEDLDKTLIDKIPLEGVAYWREFKEKYPNKNKQYYLDAKNLFKTFDESERQKINSTIDNYKENIDINYAKNPYDYLSESIYKQYKGVL